MNAFEVTFRVRYWVPDVRCCTLAYRGMALVMMLLRRYELPPFLLQDWSHSREWFATSRYQAYGIKDTVGGRFLLFHYPGSVPLALEPLRTAPTEILVTRFALRSVAPTISSGGFISKQMKQHESLVWPQRTGGALARVTLSHCEKAPKRDPPPYRTIGHALKKR